MKQKKQSGTQRGNNPKTANKNQSAGKKKASRKKYSSKVKICMQGTEKVNRETVLRLCGQAISQTKREKKPTDIITNKKKNQNKPKGHRKKGAQNKPVVINYKKLKIKRQKEAEKKAAKEAAAALDRERVTAKKGPPIITKKMIQEAREQDSKKEGILHLWGRPGSGAYKAKRKRGGKH